MKSKHKFYVLLNHDLLPSQVEEIEALNLEVMTLPSELKTLWGQIDIPVSKHIAPIIKYLKSQLNADDVVLVQGHAGATYLVVDAVKALGAKAVYAHSPHKSKSDDVQTEDTSQNIKIFKHLNFWEYGV